jgi:methyl-accepting chemotaxis protein
MLQRISLSSKLRLILACFTAGFLLLGGVSAWILQNVKVNGPRYDRIILGKDLKADILPPPGYILESYAVTLESLDASTAELEVLFQRGETLKKEFEDRYHFWESNLPTPEMRRVMFSEARPPAIRFFSVRDSIFKTALKTGELQQATEIFRKELKPLYEEHLKAVIKLVELSNQFDEAEEASARSVVSRSGVGLLVVFGVTLGFVIFLSRTVSLEVLSALKRTAAALKAAASGDFRQSLHHTVDDELGHMTRSVNEMLQSVRSVLLADVVDWAVIAENQRKAIKEKEEAAVVQQKVQTILSIVSAAAEGDLTQTVPVRGSDPIGQVGEALNTLLKNFRASVESFAKSIHGLSFASQQLSSLSTEMSATAEETSGQSNTVSAAAEQVSRSMQTVADGTEAVSESIRAIAKNATQAARVAAEAVKIAEGTNNTINRLGESSAEIGHVIKLITSIAQQTNLLALNATIEAARAGESGKGFAVVANEVKELAKATADAADVISKKVQSIQEFTHESVDAIGQIGTVIFSINEISDTIATAVEQQTSTTNNMSRTISEAATGGSEIARSIAGVAQAADATAKGASESHQAACELSGMAVELQKLVDHFRYKTPGK